MQQVERADEYLIRIIDKASVLKLSIPHMDTTGDMALMTHSRHVTASRNIDNFGRDHGRSYRWPVGGCENGNNKNLRNLWISKGIKKSLTTKERLYKKFKRKNNKWEKRKKYISYRNIFNHIVRIAKKNYYSKKLEQAGTDLTSTWNTINELQSDLY